ncbi:MAG: hypothetical protein ACRD3O_02920 [Terriglobia bacterium]
MIAATTAPRIEGYQAIAYQDTALGSTFDEILQHAESLGANAVLSTCYDDALDVDTLFHGAAVVIEPIPVTLHHQPGGTPVFPADQPAEVTGEAV